MEPGNEIWEQFLNCRSNLGNSWFSPRFFSFSLNLLQLTVNVGSTKHGSMTQIPFDQLSKEFLKEFLSPLGTVERSLEVPGESKIEMSNMRDAENEQLLMPLSQAYTEWEQETERRGERKGERKVIESLFKVRFGKLDEQLSSLVPKILTLSPEDYARLLLQLSHLTREELLARFPASESK
jgi:hypothetical protein